MKIYIASDHAGFKLKERLKKKIEMEDLSPYFLEGDDYPDYVRELCNKVLKTNGRGILICGTGIGMSIAANKIHGIRAALCWNTKTAKHSRESNDTNVLVLSGWMTKGKEALEIVKVWLKTRFEGEERHVRRINKIKKIERCGR